jgi:hypothetical protein
MDARYAEDFGAAPNRRLPPPEQLLVPDDDEDEEAMELTERGRDTPDGTTLIRASSMDRSVACDDRPIKSSYMPSNVGTRSVDVPAKMTAHSEYMCSRIVPTGRIGLSLTMNINL